MRLYGARVSFSRGEWQDSDIPVKTENLAENQNQNHADKDAALGHEGAHSLLADDADGVAGSQTREADRKTGSEVQEAPVWNDVSNVIIIELVTGPTYVNRL